MDFTRWIKDTRPQESLESRITNILNAITNQGDMSERELFSWISSELIAVLNMIKKESTNV